MSATKEKASAKDQKQKTNTKPKTATKKKVEKKEAIRKKFNGVVVSDAMDKTVLVRVDRVKVHSKYKKRYTVSRKYKVHDEKNECKVGEKLSFVECRPYSKEKRWRVIK